MKTFTEEESYQLREKIRDRRGYGYIWEVYEYPTKVFVIPEEPKDSESLLWFLCSLNVEKEIIPLDKNDKSISESI